MAVSPRTRPISGGVVSNEADLANEAAWIEALLAGKASAAQGALADSAVQPGDNIDDLAETDTAKIMSSVERAKLAGVEEGATANASDAALRARADHTGEQAISTVTGLQAALDGKVSESDLAAVDVNLGFVTDNVTFEHGAPIEFTLIKSGSGQFFRDETSRDLDLLQEYGPLTRRLVGEHGAPATLDLVKTEDGSFYRRFFYEGDLGVYGAYVDSDGNAQIVGASALWPLTDGAEGSATYKDPSNGGTFAGPKALSATVSAVAIGLVEQAFQPGYDGVPHLYQYPRRGGWSISPSYKKVLVLTLSGQSLNSAVSYGLLNGTCPAPGRLGMFAGGVRPGQMFANASKPNRFQYLYTPEDLGAIVDMREQEDTIWSAYAESDCTAVSNYMLNEVDSDTAIVGINVAVGGANTSEQGPGSATWRNLALCYAQLRMMCEDRGVEMIIGPMLWSQGGSNVADTEAEYVAEIERIYDGWQDLIEGHGGTRHEAPMLVHGMTHANDTTAGTTNGTMEVSRAPLTLMQDAVRNFVAVGPEYLYTNAEDEGLSSDTTHMGYHGVNHRSWFVYEALLGTYFGSAGYEPLRMISAVRTGAEVRVRFNTAAANIVGPIVIDNAAITAVSNAGLSWWDAGDGNSVTISNVAVESVDSGTDWEVVVTLSDTPTGTAQQLGAGLRDTATGVGGTYQGPVIGARTSIADSAGAGDDLLINGQTRTKSHALHTQLIDIT
ncbi:hypothetical protein [Pararhodobacter zhoushanensis]|uniref:Sialate O-acetylesterase domain-containing protein n=1 Tax=Pararhodobacter zhoushanensis TaxID=2479545 RepID=A0ABT3GYG0_9RHOB|nr:hypothetical protein [Pararhodobacter zhoushanensis]MCW1932604.1 hypothetical protein [Pararhodobacter zhoushanensis]